MDDYCRYCRHHIWNVALKRTSYFCRQVVGGKNATEHRTQGCVRFIYWLGDCYSYCRKQLIAKSLISVKIISH